MKKGHSVCYYLMFSAFTSGIAAGSVMVAMTSLIRSMGMSPTTLGLLFSSWERGSEGLRFSPTVTVHGERGGY